MASDNDPASNIFRSPSTILIALYIALCGGGLIFTAWHKGVWIDEAFTQFASRHDVPLAQIWHERWLTDIHPAGHYLFAWLLEPLTGQDIHLARLTNLIPLSLSLAAIFWIDSDDRNRAKLLSVLLLSSALPFDYFVEFRSYYSIVCAGTVAVFAMASALCQDRVERKLLAVFGPSSLVALTLHFLSALFFAVGGAVFLLAFWLTGERRRALIFAAILAFGCAVMAVQVAIQMPALAFYRVHFWASTTTAQALFAIGSAIALTLASSAVAWLFIVTHWRGLDRDARRILIVALAAVAAIGITAIAVNLIRPSIVRQYLAPAVPFFLVGACFAGASIVDRPKWLVPLLLAGLASVGYYTVQRSSVKDQDEMAERIARAYRRCPGQIVGIPPRIAGASEVNQRVTDASFASAYAALAERFDFPLHQAGRDECPAIVWGESSAPQIPLPLIAKRAGLDERRYDFASAFVRTSGTGFAIVVPPRGGPATAGQR